MTPTQVANVAEHLVVNPAHAASIDEIHQLVTDSRALMRGHFELQGKRHSEFFIRFKQIGRERQLVERVAQFLVSGAEWMKAKETTRVVGAESAGFYLANALSRELEVSSAIAKIDHHRRPTNELRSGDIAPQDRVVIAVDLVTTASSLRTLIKLVEDRKATLVGVAVFGVLDSIEYMKVLNERKLMGSWLVQSTWKMWNNPSECPLCAERHDAIPALEFN